MQAESDIAGHRKVWKQGVVLKHHADASRFWRKTVTRAAGDLTVDDDFTGDDTLKTRDAAQRRRLAAPTGAEQAGDGAAAQTEIDVTEHGACAVRLRDVVDLKRARHVAIIMD